MKRKPERENLAAMYALSVPEQIHMGFNLVPAKLVPLFGPAPVKKPKAGKGG